MSATLQPAMGMNLYSSAWTANWSPPTSFLYLGAINTKGLSSVSNLTSNISHLTYHPGVKLKPNTGFFTSLRLKGKA